MVLLHLLSAADSVHGSNLNLPSSGLPATFSPQERGEGNTAAALKLLISPLEAEMSGRT